MKPHILFILDYFTPHRGGSENVFQNVITRLCEKGYPITILTSRYDPVLPSYEDQQGIHIYRVGQTRLGFMFRALWEGVKVLRKEKNISYIHTSTYGGAIPASILGIIMRKKVVLTVHEVFGKLWYLFKGPIKGRLYKCFERVIFRFPYTCYHCVSRYTLNSLRLLYGIADYKMRMIYNGVDTLFWSPTKVTEAESHQRRTTHHRGDAFVVLYYGHAGKSKGLDYLIEAMPQILKKNKNIICVYNLIASKRTEEITSKIQKIKSSLQNPKRIQVFNGLDQISLRTLIASVDMVVAPSLAEGFGSVHTEVAAMQKPLLTTSIGPLPEVVWGNVEMVAPASSEAIVEGILNMAEGKKSTLLPPKEFSRGKTVQEIEALYKK